MGVGGGVEQACHRDGASLVRQAGLSPDRQVGPGASQPAAACNSAGRGTSGSNRASRAAAAAAAAAAADLEAVGGEGEVVVGGKVLGQHRVHGAAGILQASAAVSNPGATARQLEVYLGAQSQPTIGPTHLLPSPAGRDQSGLSPPCALGSPAHAPSHCPAAAR